MTDKLAAEVCVLICGQEIRVHRIERDDALINRLIELERKFWNYVETDTPPPADGSDSSAMALQCLYPHDRGSMLDFTEDRDMSSAFSDLVAIRHRKCGTGQATFIERRLNWRLIVAVAPV